MCGIAGYIGNNAAAQVGAMLDALAHRGPDGMSSFADNNCVLGHRRLAIIDLHDRAAQPMTYGDFTIVFNGEIYNHLELRAHLETRGERFTTTSDTEVLLRGFAVDGMAFVERLRGMFAFAVWNARVRELTLVRDRLGIKPLYYVRGPGFAFASEVRALFGTTERVADTSAIFDYWRYGSLRGENTIVHSIKALLPGHAMRWRDGRSETWRWYTLEDHIEAQARSYGEALTVLRKRLEDAARYHLVSDVPVGALLSAGIDSTAVVGLLAQQTSQLRTFTLGFENADGLADERAIARITAERYATQHHEIVVTTPELSGMLESFLSALDVPSADGANTFIVTRFAAEHVKVAVSGLGGDEIFAGYPHFARLAALSRVPRILPRLIGKRFGRVKLHLPRRVARLVDELALRPSSRLETLRRASDDAETRAWLAPHLEGTQVSDAPLPSIALSSVTRTSLYELHTYLVDTLLRDSDVMSMASGLELRPLLLDHPLVEWALSQPDEFKLSGGFAKRMFVDAVRDLLPAEVIDRRKTGFEVPLGLWLRTGLRERTRAAFASDQARTLMSPIGLRRLRERFESDKPVLSRTWQSFVLLDYLTRHRIALAVD